MLTTFHKHKATVVNSTDSSHTGIFSMDDYKKANGSLKTLLFLKIHIRMMKWQNTKETNAVTSSAVGVSDDPWETWGGHISSTCRACFCHVCSAYQRERGTLFLLPYHHHQQHMD